MSVRRSVLHVLLIALGLYVTLCLLLLVFQGRLVYFPGDPPTFTPKSIGLSFEELALEASDGVQIHGWLLPADEPRGALVFCHGNAGNIAGRLHAARAFREMGLSVLLFDYRGYGRSEGSPDEEGTYLDAVAAHDHLVQAAGFAPTAIVAYGESLGAGVATELAGRRPVAALIMESAFTSLPALGQELYRWLPVSLLARIHYDNAAKIGAIDAPVLVIHSPGDEIVPFAHGQRLFELASEPRERLETFGGHNAGGFLMRAEWVEQVGDFVHRALSTH